MTVQPTHTTGYRQAAIVDGIKHACKRARYGTHGRVSRIPSVNYLFVSPTIDSSYLSRQLSISECKGKTNSRA